MIDRKRFFNGIRQTPFNGLTQGQVGGIEFILDEWERRKLQDLRHLGCILANTYIETAFKMQPIKEYGSEEYLRAKKYWPWIGRGYIQLTWEANYKSFRDEVLKLFGSDIIQNPDAAMIPMVAAYIMFEGMYKGRFTGKKLGDYFTNEKSDWINSRQIINRLDRAREIAGLAKGFYADLTDSDRTGEV